MKLGLFKFYIDDIPVKLYSISGNDHLGVIVDYKLLQHIIYNNSNKDFNFTIKNSVYNKKIIFHSPIFRIDLSLFKPNHITRDISNNISVCIYLIYDINPNIYTELFSYLYGNIHGVYNNKHTLDNFNDCKRYILYNTAKHNYIDKHNIIFDIKPYEKININLNIYEIFKNKNKYKLYVFKSIANFSGDMYPRLFKTLELKEIQYKFIPKEYTIKHYVNKHWQDVELKELVII